MMGNRPITQEEIDSLIEYTKEQKAIHWTREYLIKPALLSTIYGDGKKLIALYPIDDRPNHYLILIDSKTDFRSDAWNDLLDDFIYEAIMDEFGYSTDENNEEFPAFYFGSGTVWQELHRRC